MSSYMTSFATQLEAFNSSLYRGLGPSSPAACALSPQSDWRWLHASHGVDFLSSKVFESTHPFRKAPVEKTLSFPGAVAIVLEFDRRCSTPSSGTLQVSCTSPQGEVYHKTFSGASSAGGWPEGLVRLKTNAVSFAWRSTEDSSSVAANLRFGFRVKASALMPETVAPSLFWTHDLQLLLASTVGRMVFRSTSLLITSSERKVERMVDLRVIQGFKSSVVSSTLAGPPDNAGTAQPLVRLMQRHAGTAALSSGAHDHDAAVVAQRLLTALRSSVAGRPVVTAAMSQHLAPVEDAVLALILRASGLSETAFQFAASTLGAPNSVVSPQLKIAASTTFKFLGWLLKYSQLQTRWQDLVQGVRDRRPAHDAAGDGLQAADTTDTDYVTNQLLALPLETLREYAMTFHVDIGGSRKGHGAHTEHTAAPSRDNQVPLNDASIRALAEQLAQLVIKAARSTTDQPAQPALQQVSQRVLLMVSFLEQHCDVSISVQSPDTSVPPVSALVSYLELAARSSEFTPSFLSSFLQIRSVRARNRSSALLAFASLIDATVNPHTRLLLLCNVPAQHYATNLAGISAADMAEVRRGFAAVLTSLMRVLGSLIAPPSGQLSDDASVVPPSSVAHISPSLVAMIAGFVRVSFHTEDLGWLQTCGAFDVLPRFTRSLARSLDWDSFQTLQSVPQAAQSKHSPPSAQVTAREDCLQWDLCTYALSQSEMTPQPLFECRTCGIVKVWLLPAHCLLHVAHVSDPPLCCPVRAQKNVCCQPCARVCHAGHDVHQTFQFASGFCDCGPSHLCKVSARARLNCWHHTHLRSRVLLFEVHVR